MLNNIFQPEILRHGAIAGGIIIAAIVAGVVFDRVILAGLRRAASKTKWEGDDVVINSLSGVAVFWFLIGGAYVALHTLPIPPEYLAPSKKALVVILLISITFVVSRLITGLLDLYIRKNEAANQSVSILTIIARLTIMVVGGLIILQFLGISITPILTALGVGGLAVALALQGILSNLFSGMQIIASHKVRPGDYIKLESGEEGYVTDINWQNTTVRALANNLIVVPNSKLVNAIVTNYYEPAREMSTLIQVGISYRSNLKHAEKVTIEVAKETLREVQGGVENFEPFIRYHTFGDSSIQFTVILRIKEFTDQYLVKHEFVKRLHERYEKEGIEIPFPIRTLEMRQIPNTPAPPQTNT